ncbi:UDP-glucose 4-epimerase GalE [Candidatus Berkelbacteria bacterium RBG_13_40_8]|uniref:UDP-glucose 4-epimerase n=1 Tax=Candidatus Berkelbacteria bacterium RBG_13_40_8 TaxID=1797467 RepID=A0A1F5DP90_9BACT|nr:MAG: UDP-glucose 4-epimerase GalE [Candidatus Berkelbacteria bacterium RBG_13_40_8]
MEGKVLITGGAGYIGTHTLKQLLQENFSCVVLDDLSTGFLEPIQLLKTKYPFEFIKGNLQEKDTLQKIFKNHQIDTVIHLAAKINVSESILKPQLYHQENYLGGVNLVEAMTEAGVQKLIFSSTAAVYGNPKYTPIDENHPTQPLTPYAQTKLDFEKYLERIKNLQYIILRYFNVGGSDPEGILGKSHLKSEDLIENIMKVALSQKENLEIFGSDYNTSDGTTIRDLIHVEDVAQAHVLAFKKMAELSGQIFNLGSESGTSLREIIDKASIIIGKKIPTKMTERRPGDIAVSVASAKRAKKLLGWKPQYSNLEKIVQTDWNWRKTHPLGYNFDKFPRTW